MEELKQKLIKKREEIKDERVYRVETYEEHKMLELIDLLLDVISS